MAFVPTLFPNPRLIHDLQVRVSRPTTIVGNSTVESRISKLRHHRKQWIWPSRAMYSSDRRIIQEFMSDVAQFGLNSFLFRDPDRHTWNNVSLQWAGFADKFKLTERGVDDHPIYHLDEVTVRVAGVITAYSQQIYNGIPVIAVAGAGEGSAVTISGSYLYAARFDQSDISYGLTALAGDNSPLADTLGDIALIETFEYDEALW